MHPTDTDHVDQRLRELSETLGPELVTEIIDMFRADGSAQLADLRSAYDRHDYKAMQSGAHRLLGSVLLLGARHLAQLCRTLELMARQKQESGAEPTLAELEGEFAALLTHVARPAPSP